MTSIDANTFNNATGLVYVSSSVFAKLKYIGGGAFYGCSSLALENLSMPNLESMSNNVFRLSQLKSVSNLGKITTIPDQAFNQARNLQSIVTPNTVTSIGSSAFDQCNSLVSIVIPDSVGSIGASAFYNCYSMTTVTLSSNITQIPYRLFFACSMLPSLTIPSGVTYIGEQAFLGCSRMSSITILAPTPPTLGNVNAFNNNNCTIYVPAGSVDAYKNAANWSSLASRIQAITN